MDCGGLLQEDRPGRMPRAFGRCSSLRRSPQDSQSAPCPIHHPRAAEAGRALPLHGGRGQGRLRPRAPPPAAHPHHPRPWCSSRLPPWLRGHCRRERSCGKRTGAFRCQPLGFAFPGMECIIVDKNVSLTCSLVRLPAKITGEPSCLQDSARSSSPRMLPRPPSQCRTWSLSWTVGR